MKCWLRNWLWLCNIVKWPHAWVPAQHIRRFAGASTVTPGRQCRDCGIFEELTPSAFKAFFGMRFSLVRSPQKLNRTFKRRLALTRAALMGKAR